MIEGNNDKSARLFIALAENLKLPLVQIAHGAEAGKIGQGAFETIETVAKHALQLADNYLMGLRAASGQLKLSLEPVSVSSVIYAVANDLEQLAKSYKCTIEVDYGYHLTPVMVNRSALKAALASLGQGFIELAAQSEKPAKIITLAAHGALHGVVAGVFADIDGLSKEVFSRGQALYGKAKTPLSQVSGENSAGIFIADSLFEQMDLKLRTARHNNQTGLAATLLPSRQLSLV